MALESEGERKDRLAIHFYDCRYNDILCPNKKARVDLQAGDEERKKKLENPFTRLEKYR
jgi:hypothetical protein